MSITVPTVYSRPPFSRFFAGRPITEVEWLQLIQAQHFLYSVAGARCDIMPPRDTPWTTSSLTYTQTDSSAALEDLDKYQGVLRLTREVRISSAPYHRLVLVIYGADIDVQATVFAVDTNTTLGTITASTAATGEAEQRLDLTRAQSDAGGVAGSAPRVLTVSLEARAQTTQATLYSAYLLEVIATSSLMPY